MSLFKKFRIGLIILGLLISSFPVFAEFKQFNLSIEPVYGILNGQVEEYVTYFNDDKERTLESRLTWDVKNVQYFGANIDLDLFKYVNLNFMFMQALSGESGFMIDEDWLDSSDTTFRTNYSQHTNILQQYSKTQFTLGGNIPIPGKITITPYTKITNEYFLMDGCDGFKFYESQNNVASFFEGTVISYSHLLEGFLFGTKLKIETIPNAVIKFDFGFSPTTVNIDAIDHHQHAEKNIYFNDKLKNAWVYEGSTSMFIKPVKYFGFGTKANIQYIPAVYGDSYAKKVYSIWLPTAEEGGSKSLLWSIEICGVVSF